MGHIDVHALETESGPKQIGVPLGPRLVVVGAEAGRAVIGRYLFVWHRVEGRAWLGVWRLGNCWSGTPSLSEERGTDHVQPTTI